MKLEKFTKVDVNVWAEILSKPLIFVLAFIALAAVVALIISFIFDYEALGVTSFVLLVVFSIAAGFTALDTVTDKKLEIQNNNIEIKYNTDSLTDVNSTKGKEYAKYINPETGLPTTVWFTFNENSGEPLVSIPSVKDNEGLSEEARRDIISKLTK